MRCLLYCEILNITICMYICKNKDKEKDDDSVYKNLVKRRQTYVYLYVSDVSIFHDN